MAAMFRWSPTFVGNFTMRVRVKPNECDVISKCPGSSLRLRMIQRYRARPGHKLQMRSTALTTPASVKKILLSSVSIGPWSADT